MKSEHGTRSRYVRGCRCDDCRAANRTYARRRDVYGWSERVAADWCDAEPARQHILELRAQGMGKRRIAEVAGVHLSVIDVILYGKHGSPATRVLRRNADKVLAVSLDHAPGAVVDATGARRRIRALQAIGWPLHEIASRIGWATSNLGTLASGGRECNADSARKIAAVYDALSMTPGPSARSRYWAEKRGWLPPLAWSDETIDDPSAWADLGETEPDEDAVDEVVVERLVDGAHWRDIGATKAERVEAGRRLATHNKDVLRRLGLNSGRELAIDRTAS